MLTIDSDDDLKDFIENDDSGDEENNLNIMYEVEQEEEEFIDDFSDDDFVINEEPPKSLQERMKKLNELLSKAEQYSQFLEAQTKGIDDENVNYIYFLNTYFSQKAEKKNKI